MGAIQDGRRRWDNMGATYEGNGGGWLDSYMGAIWEGEEGTGLPLGNPVPIKNYGNFISTGIDGCVWNGK
jgi:hypothetical protein